MKVLSNGNDADHESHQGPGLKQSGDLADLNL